MRDKASSSGESMKQPLTTNSSSERTSPDSAVLVSLLFVRRRWLLVLLISSAVLIPCIWQRHIEAGDLGSHIYNAWLVHLIHGGRAPGLRVVNIWQNVFFDTLLSHLASLFGFGLAEKIAVSFAVLLFFWSSFSFMAAVSGRAPWTLVPALMMITYGWTFQIGFFNYYIAIGLSFLGLSIVWAERGQRLIALALLPLIFLAHPLGLVWFLGAAVYILIAEKLSHRWHLVMLMIAGLLLWLVRKYIFSNFRVGGSHWRLYALNGIDQVVVYGNRNKFLAAALGLFVVVCVVIDVVQRRKTEGYWRRLSLPLQLYVLAELGVVLLPGTVHLAKYAAPLSLLLERLTLVSAILMISFLALLKPRAWHVIGFGVFASLFFTFLYQDTAAINQMETQVEKIVSKLPPGTRVMATILGPPTPPIYILDHIVDRACIGRCFSYGNYEPSSGQFRVRATAGNGIVTASAEDSGDIGNGTYIVKPEDLPAIQIYQCTPSITELCSRNLENGERNDRLGVHPGR